MKRIATSFLLWMGVSFAQSFVPSAFPVDQFPRETAYLGKLMGDLDALRLNRQSLQNLQGECQKVLPYPAEGLSAGFGCQFTADQQNNFVVMVAVQNRVFVFESQKIDFTKLRAARDKAVDTHVKSYANTTLLALEIHRLDNKNADLKKLEGACSNIPNIDPLPKEVRSCQLKVHADGTYTIVVTGINGSVAQVNSSTYKVEFFPHP